MIEFINDSQESPYIILREFYKKALASNQILPQAICISSYNKKTMEVSSRFVNLKIVDGNSFIFFTNYESPKAEEFKNHTQISAVLFWSSINIQIRMQAHIKKTTKQFNDNYFKKRSKDKNALAISSKQSNIIDSYNEVVSNYNFVKNNKDLYKCPHYWGGYKFTPYKIEFWEGHSSRLNKRTLYTKTDLGWNSCTLQP